MRKGEKPALLLVGPEPDAAREAGNDGAATAALPEEEDGVGCRVQWRHRCEGEAAMAATIPPGEEDQV